MNRINEWNRKTPFKKRRGFSLKSNFKSRFTEGKNLSLEKQTVFSLFCFFCILAQGFSLKMQLGFTKTYF